MLIEKYFSENSEHISVGIANINSKRENLEKNKKNIIEALDQFSEKRANLVIFPEYCLSGNFWNPERECRTYMKISCLDNLVDWLDHIVRSYIDETFQYIVFNGLMRIKGNNKKFFNTSIVLDKTGNYLENDRTYKKTFLDKMDKKYVSSGTNDMLVLETAWGKFGFLTCYDICFPQLAHELVNIRKVDALIVNAAWRRQGKREYKGLHIKEESYYQFFWDMILPALAAQNQVWIMAANTVGPHSLDGLDYCGGSGIWAPSGINLIKGSDRKEELLILHNIDIVNEFKAERKEYCYIDDFRDLSRNLKGLNTSIEKSD